MNHLRNNIAETLSRLKSFISQFQKVIVAYSGGVDSTLLLKVSKDVLGKENVIAVTAISETYPDTDKKSTEEVVRKLHLKHIYVETNELKDKNFSRNPINRCYYCKKELFTILQRLSAKFHYDVIFDGTNYDDLKDFRPGMKAKKEFGVISPLMVAKLTKDDIRQIAKYLHLPVWNKPQMACLASRIPYGIKIEKSILKKINIAENFLLKQGFTNIRVRHHKEIARIEVSADEIKLFTNETLRRKTIKKLKSLGYKYIALDLEGYRTGSLNP